MTRTVFFIDGRPEIMKEFSQRGWNVENVRPSRDTYRLNLTRELESRSIRPDLILQQENLTRRLLVSGLENFDCPRLYWGIDTHLNTHWHSSYARLFDVFCSTQKKFIPRLRMRGARDVRWLPWFAPAESPSMNWNERRFDISFVGRVTAERPARKWMVEMIEKTFANQSLGIRDGLIHRDMLAHYATSRLAPNEAIFNEVNFRLFEAASCGCVVVNPDIGPELAELYEPGLEIEIFDTILDLREILTKHLEHPNEKMGAAARKRTQAHHLVGNRVDRIIEYAQEATTNAATGSTAEKWYWLTAFHLWENRLTGVDKNEILSHLAQLEQDEDVVCALLHAQNLTGKAKEAVPGLQTLLAGKLFESSLDINLTASMLARAAGEHGLAKSFWLRHLKSSGTKTPVAPKNDCELYLFWAKELAKHDLVLRPGFAFDPTRQLPQTALECLMANLIHRPEHVETLRLIESMTRNVKGLGQIRVGFLSMLTLHQSDDWRMGLELGISNLQAFRLEQGIDEIRTALKLAKECGQLRYFEKALAARDTGGRIAEALAAG